ncbi:unnamed protein product [Amaranthus hypochondriacus]
MSDNPKIQSNAETVLRNESIDKIEEGISEKEIGSGESREYPDRPGEPDCLYYLRTGLCGYGANCRFNHPNILPSKSDENTSELPQREGQPDCGYYLKTGTCKYSRSCKYHHPLDRRGAAQVSLNTLGLPIRQDEKPCAHYMRTYVCKFGLSCKFDHPQPALPKTSIPVPGNLPVRTMGSTMPSTGIPYVGTLPAWSLPSSYVANSHVSGPHTYLPVVFPSLQTPLTAQCWNGYMENSSSISASQNFVYNPQSQAKHDTGAPQAISELPDRPNQPECRYFMTNGSCKFGSTCKFDHPKQRIAYNLGPHGLPFRPGDELCIDYSSYGICKYGPTCKFDHPMYYYGMPSIPMVDLSMFTGVTNMVIPQPTHVSQVKSSKITDLIQKADTFPNKKCLSASSKTVDQSE